MEGVFDGDCQAHAAFFLAGDQVDAYYAALGVQQGAAVAAGVYCGVGEDQAVGGVHVVGGADGAYYSGGYAVGEAEGVAYGGYPVADLQ